MLLGAFSLIPKQDTSSYVVIAKRDLAHGQILTIDDLELKKFPKEIAPDEVAKHLDQLLGMMIVSRCPAGQLISLGDICHPAKMAISLIPTGYLRGLAFANYIRYDLLASRTSRLNYRGRYHA